MKSVEPSSPQAQFPVGVPRSKRPSNVPSGAKMNNPPGAAAKILPKTSTFKPSGAPGRPLDTSVPSNSTFPGDNVPSFFTSKTNQIPRAESDTYSFFSSGENAIPLGALTSLVSNVNLPSRDRRYTPWKGSSFSGSSHLFGRP